MENTQKQVTGPLLEWVDTIARSIGNHGGNILKLDPHRILKKWKQKNHVPRQRRTKRETKELKTDGLGKVKERIVGPLLKWIEGLSKAIAASIPASVSDEAFMSNQEEPQMANLKMEPALVSNRSLYWTLKGVESPLELLAAEQEAELLLALDFLAIMEKEETENSPEPNALNLVRNNKPGDPFIHGSTANEQAFLQYKPKPRSIDDVKKDFVMPILSYLNQLAIAIKSTQDQNSVGDERVGSQGKENIEGVREIIPDTEEPLAGKLKMSDKSKLDPKVVNADINFLEKIFKKIKDKKVEGDAKREDHPLPAGFFAWPSKKAGEAIVLGETVGGSAIDLSTFFAGFDWTNLRKKLNDMEKMRRDLRTKLLQKRYKFGNSDTVHNRYFHELRTFPFQIADTGELLTLQNILINTLTDGSKVFGGQTYKLPTTEAPTTQKS